MRKYDNEFKLQAVKKIFDGQSVASVSRELGVAEGVLHNWKKLGLESSSNFERENLELRKRLRTVEQENEILKKAALIFGRGS
jgi:transposase